MTDRLPEEPRTQIAAHDPSPAATQGATAAQIDFARHNFDNHQTLIRFADTKAAALLTLLIFLGASGIPLARDVASKLNASSFGLLITACLFTLSGLGFFLGFFWTAILVYRVMTPHSPRFYSSPCCGTDMMFFAHVRQHGNSESYRDAILAAKPEILLRNLTDQVFELAHICDEKMLNLKKAKIPMLISLCCWAAGIASGFWLLVLAN